MPCWVQGGGNAFAFRDLWSDETKKNKIQKQGFRGGSVVKNPLASAEATGLILGPGRSHMPQNN